MWLITVKPLLFSPHGTSSPSVKVNLNNTIISKSINPSIDKIMHNLAIKILVYQSWSSPAKDIVARNESKWLWLPSERSIYMLTREVHNIKETKQRVTSSERVSTLCINSQHSQITAVNHVKYHRWILKGTS